MVKTSKSTTSISIHADPLLHEVPVQVSTGEFPYKWLLEENQRRGKPDEFELIDTGIFNDNRYFDVFVEYAKCRCQKTS